MHDEKIKESRELDAVIEGKVPSKKNRYKIANGRVYLDPDVRSWIEMAAWEFKRQRSSYSVLPWTHKLQVNIQFDCDERSDLDNMVATIFDALQESGVIENDKQITWLTAHKVPKGIARTYIKVRPA